MKIEKISENQIRCTLTKADLADRQLKLSELAYGTEKAKDLFRDMMQQASYEFGFEAEDIPLMIEAIPLSAECIILIITKVEYPEELDTRFSKFAPSPYEANDGEMDEASDAPQDAAEVLDLFKRLAEDSNDSRSDEAPVKDFIPLPDAINQANTSPDTHFFASNKASKEQSKDKAAKAIVLNKLYDFTDLDSIAKVGAVLEGFYTAPNTLYKDSRRELYTLLITKGDHTPEDYNRICNILSEYSTGKKCYEGSIAYLDEHAELILRGNALHVMADFN